MNANKWLSWAIMLSGVTAVIAGGANPSEKWSVWLTSIGSAAIGATMGAFFIRLGAEDLIEHTKKLLTSSLSSKFVSDTEIDDMYKKHWYRYSVGQKNGIFQWGVRKIDFNKCDTIKGIKTSIKFSDKNNNTHVYHIEAAFRGERLISFSYPPFGNESVGVEVIPFMKNSFENVQAGLSFIQTWDSNHTITPVLMCNTPLFGIKKEGVIPEKFQQELSKLWIVNIEKSSPIFPLPKIQDGISFEINDDNLRTEKSNKSNHIDP